MSAAAGAGAAGALACGAGAAVCGSTLDGTALGGMIAVAIGAASPGFGENGWISAVAGRLVSDGEKCPITILAATPTATA